MCAFSKCCNLCQNLNCSSPILDDNGYIFELDFCFDFYSDEFVDFDESGDFND